MRRDQKRFTVSEVAADWHELMIPERTMYHVQQNTVLISDEQSMKNE